jgi:plastocyanin
MRRRLAIAALVAAVVAAGLAESAPVPAGAKEPAPGDGVVEVRLGENFYKPKRVTIPAGTTVEWRNEGRNRHNVLPDRGKRFGIDELERRATYSYRFDKPGRYGYYCSFHGTPGNGQFGRVKVVKAKRGSKG